jgi:segregation and condensation protein B
VEIQGATGLDPDRAKKALAALAGDHREGVSGIVLHEVAGGWQLRTSPGNAEYARRFLRVKPQRLTRAALETLAIVAYRQPVTRPEIEEIRGVDSGAVVKALLERRLLRILGKKEEPGRPILYGTTREFLEFFSLKDLASLPTLREFHELSEEHRSIVELAPGGGAPPPTEGIADALAAVRPQEEPEASRAAGDEALAELERAMDDVEAKGRSAARALEEGRANAEPPEGGVPAEGAEPPAGRGGAGA